jgi:hypothetical protein
MAPQPRKAPADERREALEEELRREHEKALAEATAGWFSTFAIVTTAIVVIAGIAVLIVLLTS